MGFKGKKWILLLTLAILGLLCVGIGVFVVSRMNADTKTTLERPEGTQVILNLSTFSSVNAFSLDPPARSDLLYYGQDGELLKRHRRGEEVKGDFIVQTGNGDYYFYPSETVLSMAGIEKTFPNEVDTALRIRFGPDDLGYVQQTGTAYALFNVGARKDVYDGQYINISTWFASPIQMIAMTLCCPIFWTTSALTRRETALCAWSAPTAARTPSLRKTPWYMPPFPIRNLLPAMCWTKDFISFPIPACPTVIFLTAAPS